MDTKSDKIGYMKKKTKEGCEDNKKRGILEKSSKKSFVFEFVAKTSKKLHSFFIQFDCTFILIINI